MRRKLPPKDSPGAKVIIERYIAGDGRALAEELGFSSLDSLSHSVRNLYNAKVSDVAINPQLSEPTIYPAPKINIVPIKQESRWHQGEEVMLAEISDSHVGLLTPSYNSDIFRARLAILREGIIRLCLLHRKMRPVKKLVASLLGDLPQGEQIGIQGMAEEFEMGAEQQIFEVLVPEFTNFFVNLLQVFPDIEVDILPGNHGNVQRRSQTVTKRSNWDTVFGRALKLTLAKYSHIKVTMPEPAQWYMRKQAEKSNPNPGNA